MKFKRNLAFAFFLVSGAVVGNMLARFTEGIPYLGWLSFGQWVGISTQDPIQLDLVIVRMALGIEMGLNVAQIITITAAFLIYRKVAAKL